MVLKFWFRQDWGAKYWKKYRKQKLKPLYHPVKFILLYYHTYKKTCMKDLTCKRTMKIIQKHHIIVSGYPDIAYNFMIGGEGTVYEGRGWVTKSEVVDERYRWFNGKSLDIAYVGSMTDGAPEIMNMAVYEFIEYGIHLKYIHEAPEIIEIMEELIKIP